MFVFDDKTIEELSSNGGLYDYITDLENEGTLTPEEQIIIYQSALLCIQDNLSPMRITEFLNDVNDRLKSLQNY